MFDLIKKGLWINKILHVQTHARKFGLLSFFGDLWFVSKSVAHGLHLIAIAIALTRDPAESCHHIMVPGPAPYASSLRAQAGISVMNHFCFTCVFTEVSNKRQDQSWKCIDRLSTKRVLEILIRDGVPQGLYQHGGEGVDHRRRPVYGSWHCSMMMLLRWQLVNN